MSVDHPISRFPVPEISDLPDDLRRVILDVQDRTGFVPNVFLALAHRPDELRAFLAYHDALMEREGGLTKAEREMIVVATSAAQRLPLLRDRPRSDPPGPRQVTRSIADQIAINYRKADITRSAEDRCSTSPLMVAEDSRSVGDERVRTPAVRGTSPTTTSGTSPAIAALFGMSNRIANVLSMRPNDEFFTMARSQ